MNKKRSALLLLLGGCMVGVLSLHWAPPPPPPPPPQNDFEQNPPVPTNFWVMQLPKPMDDGSNMRIRIKYTELEVTPPQLKVYIGTTPIALYDDGTGADSVAGDSIYSAYVTENIPQFQSTVNATVQNISQTTLLTFAGHLGTEVPGRTSFDNNNFNNFAEVPVDPIIFSPAGITTGTGCSSTLIKQNSLFITDLSVVEDPARTFNEVTGVGNPSGVWTFGNLITNMSGSHSPLDVLQSWLQSYLPSAPLVISGQPVSRRPHVIDYLIAPWLVKAGVVPTESAVTEANWATLWHTAPVGAILKTAPFKLTAIVNRLDVRGNSGYGGGVSNSGETRFIFTLIDPNAGDGPFPLGSHGGLTSGMPPINDSNEIPPTNFYDWRGMNIIFEFGNTENNLCDVVHFANQWVNLSTLTLGSSAYNAALESITHTVIDAGAGAAAGKPNGSALNRLRSNERIFDTSSRLLVPPWAISDWEFRQFELQSTSGLFAQVTLTNTPVNAANGVNTSGSPAEVNFTPNIPLNPLDQANLMNWVFSSPAVMTQILNGNHSMPAVFGGRPLLSIGARVDMEYLHYLDLDWNTTGAPNYTPHIPSVPGNTTYKKAREQLSLNTCQGCHNGETQTIFTEVAAIGYGKPARYWTSTPDFTSGRIDERFVSEGTPASSLGIYPPPPNPEDVVVVSAFLTGRNFRIPVGGSANYDANNNPSENLTDNTLTGLFYVNSPDNFTTNKIGITNQLWGYNDLQRRAIDLCALANTNCTAFSTLGLFAILSAIPLPLGGH
ncbi:MAG: hypothetical protein P4L41_13735 [Flavipsychrobacter sp.]|nr:hypothetical protein [Flavipsychrobacter sp.]